MRHKDWVLAPGNGSPGVALEIQMRSDAMVPVITVRGLPAPAAVAGAFVVKPSVNLGFDGGKRLELSCGMSGTYYACAPDAASLRAVAEALPKAKVVSAGVTLTMPGMMALPPQERLLDLTGTETALAKLRAGGAIREALPEYPGLDMQGFLDRILRDVGFPNGAGDVMPKLTPWISRLWS